MGARIIEGLLVAQELHGKQTPGNSTISEAPLLLYVAASDHAVSGVLVQEKEQESKVIQQPIYYISEALLGQKLNYIEIEKIAFAVLISSRKLKHYFQTHEITVPSSQPLGDILNNKEAYERIGKWATKLS
jgi:hypothetical protein